MEISRTAFFFEILTIQNDQISYVKCVLAPLYVFFTLFGGWGGGGAPKGSGAQPAIMQFSSLNSSEMVVPLPSSRCLAEGNRICSERGGGGVSSPRMVGGLRKRPVPSPRANSVCFYRMLMGKKACTCICVCSS